MQNKNDLRSAIGPGVALKGSDENECHTRNTPVTGSEITQLEHILSKDPRTYRVVELHGNGTSGTDDSETENGETSQSRNGPRTV